MAKRRHHKRRRRNAYGFTNTLSNPRRRRKHRRSRRANPRRRHHRRRRNPSFGGVVSTAKSLLKHDAVGGAIAGALNAALVNDWAISLGSMISSDPSKTATVKSLTQLGIGVALSVLANKVSATRQYAGPMAAGFSAIATNALVGRAMGKPEATLADLADQYGELVAKNARLQGFGYLGPKDVHFNGLGMVDVVTDDA